MRRCGDTGGALWEEYGPEIYAGKRKQKCNKDYKESYLHTSWLDW